MGKLKLFVADLLVKSFGALMPTQLIQDRRYFTFWEKKGFHVTPNHFYEPIPDLSQLTETIWSRRQNLVGLDMNEDGQLNMLSNYQARFRDEYDQLPLDKSSAQNEYEYYINNGRFAEVDGEILYCMIRHFGCRKILEIGSGFSSYLSARALLKNGELTGINGELVSIEPYPNEVLKKGFPGLSKQITAKVQDIELSEFSSLQENDILFIDSSHVLKIGSDVQYEYLEILPRLNKGVIVHIHDIFLPAEYLREWVLTKYRFFNEQYLLQAFMTYNDRFEVLWGGSYMHLTYPELLTNAFRSYDRAKSWPASFWIRKIK